MSDINERFKYPSSELLTNEQVQTRQELVQSILVSPNPGNHIPSVLTIYPQDSPEREFIQSEFPPIPADQLIEYAQAFELLSGKIGHLQRAQLLSGRGLYSAEFAFPELHTLTKSQLFAFLSVSMIHEGDNFNRERHLRLSKVCNQYSPEELWPEIDREKGFYCLRLLKGWVENTPIIAESEVISEFLIYRINLYQLQ
jgi:hypothetical protein